MPDITAIRKLRLKWMREYWKKTVVLETEWGLRGVYNLDRNAINNELR